MPTIGAVILERFQTLFADILFTPPPKKKMWKNFPEHLKKIYCGWTVLSHNGVVTGSTWDKNQMCRLLPKDKMRREDKMRKLLKSSGC